jgi:hypothetical protein
MEKIIDSLLSGLVEQKSARIVKSTHNRVQFVYRHFRCTVVPVSNPAIQTLIKSGVASSGGTVYAQLDGVGIFNLNKLEEFASLVYALNDDKSKSK